MRRVIHAELPARQGFGGADNKTKLSGTETLEVRRILSPSWQTPESSGPAPGVD